MKRIPSIKAMAVAAVALTGQGIGLAEPPRIIRMVGPFEAGGYTDTLLRKVIPHVAKELGQTVIMENRPGASGAVAGLAVKAAPPDGSVLLVGNNTATSGVAALNKKPAYDPLASFSSITLLGYSTVYLFSSGQRPEKTLDEIVSYGRAHPNKLSCGYAHATGQIACAKLLQLAKIDMVLVPYKGEPAMMADMVEGRVDITFGTPAVLMPQVTEGKIRAIATMMSQRTPQAPSVPTMAEAGMAGFVKPGWTAIFAPKTLPLAERERIAKAFQNAMRQPDVIETAARLPLEIKTTSPAEMDRFLADEVAMYKQVVAAANIELQ